MNFITSAARWLRKVGSHRHQSASPHDGPPRHRILIVDDEPLVLEVLSAFMRQEGHDVGTAKNGVEGLVCFLRGEWDLVMTDRAMPKMDGDQLAAAIKECDPEMPVIMITGFDPDPDDHRLTTDLVISKPFTRASIREGIAQVMGRRRAWKRNGSESRSARGVNRTRSVSNPISNSV